MKSLAIVSTVFLVNWIVVSYFLSQFRWQGAPFPLHANVVLTLAMSAITGLLGAWIFDKK